MFTYSETWRDNKLAVGSRITSSSPLTMAELGVGYIYLESNGEIMEMFSIEDENDKSQIPFNNIPEGYHTIAVVSPAGSPMLGELSFLVERNQNREYFVPAFTEIPVFIKALDSNYNPITERNVQIRIANMEALSSDSITITTDKWGFTNHLIAAHEINGSSVEYEAVIDGFNPVLFSVDPSSTCIALRFD